MTTWTGLRWQRAGQGFTLLEVLLATLLLLLLFGAVVFSFGGFQRGASLDEAALQIGGLLHFARSQAAQTGRRVQIEFTEQVDDDWFLALGGLRVVWEPDPIEEPGVFKPLPEAGAYVQRISEVVMIESVRPLDVNGRELAPNLEATTTDSTVADDPELFFDANASETPPINFYPDGSSDSAVLVVTSWDADDTRRIEIALRGVTGTIRRRLVESTGDAFGLEPAGDATATNPASEPASDEWWDLF